MDDEVAKEFASSLSDLKYNSSPVISMLTMVAWEKKNFAQQIVKVIETRLLRTPVNQKLPCLYLIDSIVKNVAKTDETSEQETNTNYQKLFSKNLVFTFCTVFKKVNEKTRLSMLKMRQTWTGLFDSRLLQELDIKVNRIDPNWPVVADPQSGTTALTEQRHGVVRLSTGVHVNPKLIMKQPQLAPEQSSLRDDLNDVQPVLSLIKNESIHENILQVDKFSIKQPGVAVGTPPNTLLQQTQQDLIILQQQILQQEPAAAEANLDEQSKPLLQEKQQIEFQHMTAKHASIAQVVSAVKASAPISSLNRDPREKAQNDGIVESEHQTAVILPSPPVLQEITVTTIDSFKVGGTMKQRKCKWTIPSRVDILRDSSHKKFRKKQIQQRAIASATLIANNRDGTAENFREMTNSKATKHTLAVKRHCHNAKEKKKSLCQPTTTTSQVALRATIQPTTNTMVGLMADASDNSKMPTSDEPVAITDSLNMTSQAIEEPSRELVLSLAADKSCGRLAISNANVDSANRTELSGGSDDCSDDESMNKIVSLEVADESVNQIITLPLDSQHSIIDLSMECDELSSENEAFQITDVRTLATTASEVADRATNQAHDAGTYSDDVFSIKQDSIVQNESLDFSKPADESLSMTCDNDMENDLVRDHGYVNLKELGPLGQLQFDVQDNYLNVAGTMLPDVSNVDIISLEQRLKKQRAALHAKISSLKKKMARTLKTEAVNGYTYFPEGTMPVRNVSDLTDDVKKSLASTYVAPQYLLPFSYGWRRELVLRNFWPLRLRAKDIYYFSPEGVKLRSGIEIDSYLADNFTHNLSFGDGREQLSRMNFTFRRYTIYQEPLETIRFAAFSKNGLMFKKFPTQSNGFAQNETNTDGGLDPDWNPTKLSSTPTTVLESVFFDHTYGLNPYWHQPESNASKLEICRQIKKRKFTVAKGEVGANGHHVNEAIESVRTKIKLEIQNETISVAEMNGDCSQPTGKKSVANATNRLQTTIRDLIPPYHNILNGPSIRVSSDQPTIPVIPKPMPRLMFIPSVTRSSSVFIMPRLTPKLSSPVQPVKKSFASAAPVRHCSLVCPLAPGVPPSVVCQRCMLLYHPICAGLQSQSSYKQFICMSCKSHMPAAVSTGAVLTFTFSQQSTSTAQSSVVTVKPRLPSLLASQIISAIRRPLLISNVNTTRIPQLLSSQILSTVVTPYSKPTLGLPPALIRAPVARISAPIAISPRQLPIGTIVIAPDSGSGVKSAFLNKSVDGCSNHGISWDPATSRLQRSISSTLADAGLLNVSPVSTIGFDIRTPLTPVSFSTSSVRTDIRSQMGAPVSLVTSSITSTGTAVSWSPITACIPSRLPVSAAVENGTFYNCRIQISRIPPAGDTVDYPSVWSPVRMHSGAAYVTLPSWIIDQIDSTELVAIQLFSHRLVIPRSFLSATADGYTAVIPQAYIQQIPKSQRFLARDPSLTMQKSQPVEKHAGGDRASPPGVNETHVQNSINHTSEPLVDIKKEPDEENLVCKDVLFETINNDDVDTSESISSKAKEISSHTADVCKLSKATNSISSGAKVMDSLTRVLHPGDTAKVLEIRNGDIQVECGENSDTIYLDRTVVVKDQRLRTVQKVVLNATSKKSYPTGESLKLICRGDQDTAHFDDDETHVVDMDSDGPQCRKTVVSSEQVARKKHLQEKHLHVLVSKIGIDPASTPNITDDTNNSSRIQESLRTKRRDWLAGRRNGLWMLQTGLRTMVHIFQYLSPASLLVAGQVCKDWNLVSKQQCLWNSFTLRHCRVNNWSSAMHYFSLVRPQLLDLRHPSLGLLDYSTWEQIKEGLTKLTNLQHIEFSQCPVNVLNNVIDKLTELKTLTVEFVTAASSSITVTPFALSQLVWFDLTRLSSLKNLEHLHLRGSPGINIFTMSLRNMGLQFSHLHTLSITSMCSPNDKFLSFVPQLKQLRILELGDCYEWSSEMFASLAQLLNLHTLRLECGSDSNDGAFSRALLQMTNLRHLELIRYVVTLKLMSTIPHLTHLQTLSIWPRLHKLHRFGLGHLNASVLRMVNSMGFLTRLDWGFLINAGCSTPPPSSSTVAQTQMQQVNTVVSIPFCNVTFIDEPPSFSVTHSQQKELISLDSLINVLVAALPNTKVRLFMVPESADIAT